MSQHRVVNEVADYSALIESSIELHTTGRLQFLWTDFRAAFRTMIYTDLISWNLRESLSCMALFSPMASACALTMAFNISGHGISIVQSGSWLYYILLPDGLLCSVSCFCISSSGRVCLFLVYLQASLAVWDCFHSWLSLVHWPWFSTLLDMVFNASEWLIALWHGLSPRWNFVRRFIFGYSFKWACLSFFMFLFRWAWEDATGGALLSDCRAVWWGKIASQYRSASTSFYL